MKTKCDGTPRRLIWGIGLYGVLGKGGLNREIIVEDVVADLPLELRKKGGNERKISGNGSYMR